MTRPLSSQAGDRPASASSGIVEIIVPQVDGPLGPRADRVERRRGRDVEQRVAGLGHRLAQGDVQRLSGQRGAHAATLDRHVGDGPQGRPHAVHGSQSQRFALVSEEQVRAGHKLGQVVLAASADAREAVLQALAQAEQGGQGLDLPPAGRRSERRRRRDGTAKIGCDTALDRAPACPGWQLLDLTCEAGGA